MSKINTVTVTKETTFAELAADAGVKLGDLIKSTFAEGHIIIGRHRVLSSAIPRQTIRNVTKELGFKARLQVMSDAALRKNDKFNEKPAAKKTATAVDALTEAFGKATRTRRVRKPVEVVEVTTTKKSVKKTSTNTSGLTIRELEKEIFKIEGIRIVIRAASHLRSGCTVYGKRVPAVATVASLTKRLNGYFRQSRHAEELKDVEFVVITPRGEAHHNTRSKKLKLDRVRFE